MTEARPLTKEEVWQSNRADLWRIVKSEHKKVRDKGDTVLGWKSWKDALLRSHKFVIHESGAHELRSCPPSEAHIRPTPVEDDAGTGKNAPSKSLVLAAPPSNDGSADADKSGSPTKARKTRKKRDRAATITAASPEKKKSRTPSEADAWSDDHASGDKDLAMFQAPPITPLAITDASNDDDSDGSAVTTILVGTLSDSTHAGPGGPDTVMADDSGAPGPAPPTNESQTDSATDAPASGAGKTPGKTLKEKKRERKSKRGDKKTDKAAGVSKQQQPPPKATGKERQIQRATDKALKAMAALESAKAAGATTTGKPGPKGRKDNTNKDEGKKPAGPAPGNSPDEAQGRCLFMQRPANAGSISEARIMDAILDFYEEKKLGPCLTAFRAHGNGYILEFAKKDDAEHLLSLDHTFVINKVKFRATAYRGGGCRVFFLVNTGPYNDAGVVIGLTRIFPEKSFSLYHCNRRGVWTDKWLLIFEGPPTTHSRAIPLGERDGEGRFGRMAMLQPVPAGAACPWCDLVHDGRACPRAVGVRHTALLPPCES